MHNKTLSMQAFSTQSERVWANDRDRASKKHNFSRNLREARKNEIISPHQIINQTVFAWH